MKCLEDVSQLKKDPFALHSFEIVILVMFLKNCQNLFSFALLIIPTALSEGGRGAGLFKCSLTFKVGYLIKRGAYLETRRNYNVPLLISKSENVISCQQRCLPLTSATLKLVGFVPKFDQYSKAETKA